jgi:hypothetical protein
MGRGTLPYPARVEEALAGTVVATDPASVNAD